MEASENSYSNFISAPSRRITDRFNALSGATFDNLEKWRIGLGASRQSAGKG